MTATSSSQTAAPGTPERPRRKRRWLRWTLVGVVMLVVFSVAAVAAAVKLQPTPAPLALPTSAAPPVGPIEGTWQMAPGSVAGFRIQQTVLAMTSDVVGRTEDITGTAVVAGDQVTSANFRVNLLALTSGGKPAAPQFSISLDTAHHPDATVALAQPVAIEGAFATGAPTTATASAQLTLRGVTRTVSVELSARRDGAEVELAGSVPVTFADWGIAEPKGYGALGSLADHGVAEFLLVLQRG